MPLGPEMRDRAERICMLLFNPFQHDARVLKEGTTLDRAGYDVRLVAVAAPAVPRREQRDGIRIIRVDGQPRTMRRTRRAAARPRAIRRQYAGARPRPVGDAASVNAAGRGGGPAARLRELAGRAYGVMAWTRFARAALRAACAEPADIVLAHDLNTLPVAALAARRLRCSSPLRLPRGVCRAARAQQARAPALAGGRAGAAAEGGVDVDEQSRATPRCSPPTMACRCRR